MLITMISKVFNLKGNRAEVIQQLLAYNFNQFQPGLDWADPQNFDHLFLKEIIRKCRLPEEDAVISAEDRLVATKQLFYQRETLNAKFNSVFERVAVLRDRYGPTFYTNPLYTTEELYEKDRKLRIPEIGWIVNEVKKVVIHILGKAPTDLQPAFQKEDWDEESSDVAFLGKFTSGATVSLPRGNHPIHRVTAPRFTKWCWDAYGYKDDMLWGDRIVIQDYGIVDFVPKSEKIDRLIVKGLEGNLAYQRGYALHVRSCLKKRGLDLRQAQAVHQRLAKLYSINKMGATEDGENYSNSLCLNLLTLVFPDDHLEILSKLRVPNVLIDDKILPLQAFAPNGDGVCFEVQTVITWAILTVCTMYSGNITMREALKLCFANGDDMINPTYAYSMIEYVMQCIGVKINPQKSFHGNDPGRESCGADYYNGISIRGVNLEQLPNEVPQWVSLANSIYDKYYLRHNNRWCSSNIFRIWMRCILSIPKDQRYFGPPEYEDSTINTIRESLWTRCRKPVMDFEKHRKALSLMNFRKRKRAEKGAYNSMSTLQSTYYRSFPKSSKSDIHELQKDIGFSQLKNLALIGVLRGQGQRGLGLFEQKDPWYPRLTIPALGKPGERGKTVKKNVVVCESSEFQKWETVDELFDLLWKKHFHGREVTSLQPYGPLALFFPVETFNLKVEDAIERVPVITHVEDVDATIFDML